MKEIKDMNMKELMVIAKGLNIKGRSKMNKAALVEAVEARTVTITEVVEEDNTCGSCGHEDCICNEDAACNQKKTQPIEEEPKPYVPQDTIPMTDHRAIIGEINVLLRDSRTDWRYSQQIQPGKRTMDCRKCQNEGRGPWAPDQGICYWCNGDTYVTITSKVLTLWWSRWDRRLQNARWLWKRSRDIRNKERLTQVGEVIKGEMDRLNKIQGRK